MVNTLASRLSCLGAIPNVSEFFQRKKNVDQWRCLKKSGQWLENVDQTHLVLARGKLVLQKHSELSVVLLRPL